MQHLIKRVNLSRFQKAHYTLKMKFHFSFKALFLLQRNNLPFFISIFRVCYEGLFYYADT